NFVANLLRCLFLQAAAAQVQLLAVATAQNTLGTVGIAPVRRGGAGTARELAHQRILDRRRAATAEIVVLNAELQHAGDVAGAARGDRVSRQSIANAAEVSESAGRSATCALVEQVSELRLGD